jgi:Protein of unknown function (DUF3224)
MTTGASGTFEVQMNPQGLEDKSEGVTLGRMSLDKKFSGDLDGTSKGEMLTALTPVKGSAGYVAIERVTGTMQGRRGSFVLQHSGIMTCGRRNSRSPVPDSDTGELAGIAGEMKIIIAGGKHSHEFDYTLAPPK